MKKREFLKAVFDLDIYGDYRLEFCKVSDSIEITLVCFDEFTKTIYFDETYIYDTEGEIITNIETLDKFSEWLEFNICDKCEGSGYVEVDISHQCFRYKEDCCGGCTAIVVCECKE